MAARESLATALPLGTITQLAEISTTTSGASANGEATAVTSTPASDAAGEIINVCACVFGMAAYTACRSGGSHAPSLLILTWQSAAGAGRASEGAPRAPAAAPAPAPSATGVVA